MRRSRARSTIAFISLSASAALLLLSTVQVPSVSATESTFSISDASATSSNEAHTPFPPTASFDAPTPESDENSLIHVESAATSDATPDVNASRSADPPLENSESESPAPEELNASASAEEEIAPPAEHPIEGSPSADAQPSNTDAPESQPNGTTTDKPQSSSSSFRFRSATNSSLMSDNPRDALLEPAVRATGGLGKYKELILWMGWPKGQLIRTQNDSASANKNIPTSLTHHNYVDVTPRVRLVTTCTINNLRYTRRSDGAAYSAESKPVPIESYIPGGWHGDFLDNLYNIGGDGRSNQMNIGIKNNDITAQNANFTFNVACQAQILTRPTPGSGDFTEATRFPIDGLVITDAESAGYHANGKEYVQATTKNKASWYLLDRIQDPGCQGTRAERAKLPSQNLRQVANATFSHIQGNTITILPNGSECAYNKPLGTPGEPCSRRVFHQLPSPSKVTARKRLHWELLFRETLEMRQSPMVKLLFSTIHVGKTPYPKR